MVRFYRLARLFFFLYDFLRRIQQDAAPTFEYNFEEHNDLSISRAEFQWLTSFLRNPGVIIEFHARKTGRMIRVPAEQPPPDVFSMVLAPKFPKLPEETVEEEVEQHYQLAGSAEEVFQLLTEAMLLNPTWASLVVAAGRYYTTHVPMCRKCSQRHNGRLAEDCPDVQEPKWEFKPRQQ